MHQDVVELREFYRSPLGGVARRLLTHRLRARWRNTSGQTVMGLGYALAESGETVRAKDPQFSPEVEAAWRETMAFGIQQMRARYE